MAEFTEKDLRKARESKGLPRWKLGEKIGVSESTIERWESGETVPTPEDIDNIGEALGDVRDPYEASVANARAAAAELAASTSAAPIWPCR